MGCLSFLIPLLACWPASEYWLELDIRLQQYAFIRFFILEENNCFFFLAPNDVAVFSSFSSVEFRPAI